MLLFTPVVWGIIKRGSRSESKRCVTLSHPHALIGKHPIAFHSCCYAVLSLRNGNPYTKAILSVVVVSELSSYHACSEPLTPLLCKMVHFVRQKLSYYATISCRLHCKDDAFSGPLLLLSFLKRQRHHNHHYGNGQPCGIILHLKTSHAAQQAT